MASQENLDTSFDKSFMLLCHHPHQAVSHGNLLDMHRVSKSFNHINIPPSPHFEKFENVPKYASNDNEFIKNNVLPLPGRSHFERKSLMAKTMVSTVERDKIKVMEANNFVKETNNFDKDAKEAKNVKIINLKEDANDSRRDSAQIISANYRKSHFNKEEVNVFKVSEEIKKSRRMLRLERFLDSVLFQVLITTFIMYALFGSDFKFYFFSKSQDFVFDILTFLSLGIFSLEIILSMITKKDYLFSFFFWLDIMSTMTLILDLSWVNEAILYHLFCQFFFFFFFFFLVPIFFYFDKTLIFFIFSGGNTSQFSKGKQSTKIGSRFLILSFLSLKRLTQCRENNSNSSSISSNPNNQNLEEF